MERKVTKRGIISLFINLALASAKLKSLTLVEKNAVIPIRPQMNILIYGRIGSTKSTMLKEICRKSGAKSPVTDLTFPALVGSIDSTTKMIIPASSWECRNSIMLLDEFYMGMRNSITVNALLQLSEGGEYSRKIASFSVPSNEQDGDLYFKCSSGRIDIKTRFSLILATMRNIEYTQSNLVKGLASRCICIPYYPSMDELERIADGNPTYFHKEFPVRELNPVIKIKDYNLIKRLVIGENISKESFLRGIGDCCRAYAVLGKHDRKLYKFICSLKNIEFKTYLGKAKKEILQVKEDES